MQRTALTRRGFTLIELSVVLVVIGLIVGGVLVGVELVKGAEVRATVSQIEKYQTATNTFQNKYGGLPGDLKAAATYGLGPSGNGNLLIEDSVPSNGWDYYPDGEVTYFWQHLSTAGLIDGGYDGGQLRVGALPIVYGQTFPAAKYGRGVSFTAYYVKGVNYLEAGILTYTPPGGGTSMKLINGGFTPADAYAVDLKMDDGIPANGMIQGAWPNNQLVGQSSNAGCTTGVPATYVLGQTTPYCALFIRLR